MVLSHAQATEVAKRFNPARGQTYWFSDDGSLLSRTETHRQVAEQNRASARLCLPDPPLTVKVASHSAQVETAAAMEPNNGPLARSTPR